MSDLSIRSTPAPATADHTWLAGDSSAFATAQSGTIQVSSLTAGTHYDNTTKVVPAGLVLSKSGNFFIPYVAGTGVKIAGITAYPIELLREDGATSSVVIFPRVVEGVLIPANLPVAAQRTIDDASPSVCAFSFIL
jgi:hypothetical protein